MEKKKFTKFHQKVLINQFRWGLVMLDYDQPRAHIE